MKKKIIVLSSVRALDSSLGSASTIESCDMQSAVQFDSSINNSATLEISTRLFTDTAADFNLHSLTLQVRVSFSDSRVF
ncbi:hypothetical protein LWI29_017323 [Acer saccharum]|uniref:Uncharacterized protein n=1 Tax=Acer saccharum TaxID=4024 RepID=A0AA39V1B7_ACESA|nr:hypothetical protein LWI29_017323 [Acer saccharum]